MTVPTWLALLLGLGLISIAVLDVFLTVLHVQVESPISNRINRALWRGLLALTRTLPAGTRGEILAWGVPLMIGTMILIWGAQYVIGFGLLYLPFIHDPAIFSTEDAGTSSALGDAWYFSAVSFFTIGYGDIRPVHPLARLLAVVEGASGLLTVSLSVTYLLSVYPLISRKVAIAVALNQETAGRSDGVVVAARYLPAGRVDALAERLRWLNDELLNIGHSHGFYPILYYVRPRGVHESFARTLAVTQGLIATLRYGLDPSVHRDVVSDPRLAILEEGLLYVLHVLAESSHLAPEAESRCDIERARADYCALQRELNEHGLTAVRPGDDATAEAHARFRAATDRYIRAYAANIGYEPDALWATYDRWSRDSALDSRQ